MGRRIREHRKLRDLRYLTLPFATRKVEVYRVQPRLNETVRDLRYFLFSMVFSVFLTCLKLATVRDLRYLQALNSRQYVTCATLLPPSICLCDLGYLQALNSRQYVTCATFRP